MLKNCNVENTVLNRKNTEFLTEIRVYIEDTDSGGIVYHANYIKFIERARTDFLRSLGVEHGIGENPLIFVVYSIDIQFLQTACLHDLLLVSAKILKRARTYLIFEQTIKRKSGDSGVDELIDICRATVKVACVDENKRPRIIPPSVIILLDDQCVD